jgi:GYF domain 2
VEHVYYLIIDGEKCGPFRKDDLLDAGMDGDTLVWYAGRDGWIRADKLVLFDELLKQERKAIKQKRKVQRKIAQLPDPEKLRRWSRTAIMVNMPAGALYVVGTALLIAAMVVSIVGDSGGPNDPPSRILIIVTWVLFVAGMLATGLAVVLIGIELGLMAAFTWSCRRIVRVLSPRGDKAQISAHGFFQDIFDMVNIPGAGVIESTDMTNVSDLRFLWAFSLLALLMGAPCLVVVAVVVARAIYYLIALACFIVCAIVFLVPYIIVAFSIYRLGFGLNRIVNDCKIQAPWAPVTLAFWVALCGLLIVLGPLSVPFFVLAPIWLRKVTVTVVAICEQSIDAVEGPVAPALSAAPPAADEQPGWNKAMP